MMCACVCFFVRCLHTATHTRNSHWVAIFHVREFPFFFLHPKIHINTTLRDETRRTHVSFRFKRLFVRANTFISIHRVCRARARRIRRKWHITFDIQYLMKIQWENLNYFFLSQIQYSSRWQAKDVFCVANDTEHISI